MNKDNSAAHRHWGKFISFEGGEGVGKSTHVKILCGMLRDKGIDVIVTREPGGSPGAEEIRQLLLKGEVDKWNPMTEVLLFNAARVDHLAKIIFPALKRGQWVISDRYADSTFAYQGAGHGLNPAIIQEIHALATDNFWPDITILLDGSPKDGLARAHHRESALSEALREDRFEKLTGGYHDRLRAAFLGLACENPDRIRVIASGGTIDEISIRIWQQVKSDFDIP